MPVTNTELADYLNARIDLEGKTAITANVIRQWVAWGVLTKASATGKAIGIGPSWSRDGTAIRRAVRLAELRGLNIRRESALIVQAFVEWGHPDLDRVRNALGQEFSKWRNQLIRRQITFIGDSPFSAISQVQKRAIRKQNGPLDSRFVGSKFEFSAETFAVISQFASMGFGNADDLNSIFIDLKQRFIPSDEFDLSQFFPLFINSISGLNASQDETENSAQEAITISSDRQLRIARILIRNCIKMVKAPRIFEDFSDSIPIRSDLAKMFRWLSPQISIGPWIVLAMAQAVQAIVRNPEIGIAFQEFGVKKFPPFDMLAYGNKPRKD